MLLWLMMLLGLYLKTKENLKSSDSNDDKESREPDCGEDEDQLEEQEKESEEITAAKNHVF